MLGSNTVPSKFWVGYQNKGKCSNPRLESCIKLIARKGSLSEKHWKDLYFWLNVRHGIGSFTYWHLSRSVEKVEEQKIICLSLWCIYSPLWRHAGGYYLDTLMKSLSMKRFCNDFMDVFNIQKLFAPKVYRTCNQINIKGILQYTYFEIRNIQDCFTCRRT